MNPARRDAQALSNFIKQSEFLHSLFLLWREPENGDEIEEIDTFRRFAAWFLLEGRRLYATHVVIDRALIDALTRPDAQGGHVLMRLLAQTTGKHLDGPALQSWYRHEGVPRFGLAPFLNAGETHTFLENAGVKSQSQVGHLTAPAYDGTIRALGAKFADFGHHARGKRGEGRCDERPTVSIVGFHRSVLGIGEDARALFDCFRHIGILAELVDVSPLGLEAIYDADAYAPFEATRPSGSIVVFCLPAFEMMGALTKLNLTPSRGRYMVGYWPWETTALPEIWDHAYQYVDEIWASSHFLCQVYAPKTSKPVTHVPLHVHVDVGPLRPDLKAIFDGAFSFVAVFDFNSGMGRKNPEGTIDAFTRAFPRGGERVQLVLKTIHGNNRPADLARIVSRARDDGRIVVVDGAVPRRDICAMLAAADAYISLHRAEGFGRPIAEAMMLETPVVATAWSGPSDFLTAETGYPVASTLRAVQRGEYPFASGSWAEPDIEHAAAQMRALLHDQGRAGRIVRAKAFVEAHYAREPVAAVLAAELERIQATMGPS